MINLYMRPEDEPASENPNWPYPPVEDGVPQGDDTTNVPPEDYGKIFES